MFSSSHDPIHSDQENLINSPTENRRMSSRRKYLLVGFVFTLVGTATGLGTYFGLRNNDSNDAIPQTEGFCGGGGTSPSTQISCPSLPKFLAQDYFVKHGVASTANWATLKHECCPENPPYPVGNVCCPGSPYSNFHYYHVTVNGVPGAPQELTFYIGNILANDSSSVSGELVGFFQGPSSFNGVGVPCQDEDGTVFCAYSGYDSYKAVPSIEPWASDPSADWLTNGISVAASYFNNSLATSKKFIQSLYQRNTLFSSTQLKKNIELNHDEMKEPSNPSLIRLN